MSKLRTIATKEVNETIISKVADWYTWTLENKGELVEFKASVGHISNENMSINIDTEAGQLVIDLEKWFVKGIAKGKGYRFGQKAIQNTQTYTK